MARETLKEVQAQRDLLIEEVKGLRNLIFDNCKTHEEELSRLASESYFIGLTEGFQDAEASYHSQSFINRLLNRAF